MLCSARDNLKIGATKYLCEGETAPNDVHWGTVEYHLVVASFGWARKLKDKLLVENIARYVMTVSAGVTCDCEPGLSDESWVVTCVRSVEHNLCVP